jgi:adenine deaminase
MVREGAVRKDLAEIAKITKQGIDLRRLILVSDSISPGDLIKNGYMEGIVQKAIDCGFEPINAIQMATLNVAEHFSLDHLIGGIAPGRYADLAIIPDIATIDAEVVVSNGQIIAQNGSIVIPPHNHAFSEESLNTIKLPREFAPSDFIIQAPDNTKKVRIRVINMITDLVTSEQEMNRPVTEGQLSINLAEDIVKIAAIDRTRNHGKLFVGLIRGFGLKSGAIASSAAWDTSDIVVVGADDADMAFAVNRIRSLQGGTVVCENGKILSELPLPVFGIISDLPLETIDQRFKDVAKAAKNLGSPFPEPMLSLITLTGAAIPYLRICEQGLVNLKDGKNVSLFVN